MAEGSEFEMTCHGRPRRFRIRRIVAVGEGEGESQQGGVEASLEERWVARAFRF